MHSSRRIRSLTITLAAVVLTVLGLRWTAGRLGDESTFSGIVLLLATASLYLLSVRKQWIALRLGPVSAWLQWHMYAGTLASVVFLMHMGWPTGGTFEMCLAACFAFVAASGMVLAVMNRRTPQRLAAIQRDYALEQIPGLQLAVAQDAHQLALSSTRVGEGATLSEYYQRRLVTYFHTPRGWLYRLIPTGLLRRQLLRELEDLDRYLAREGLRLRRKLSLLVQSKDDLDYHQALQLRLRLLYATHFSLTWTLVILIAVHVVLVWRFSGVML
ncbi:MAG: hypothetical protein KF752_20880 [Pirellulaceae bacterium]|nr:hypothetical protein [Pirellulaceae bacterium]